MFNSVGLTDVAATVQAATSQSWPVTHLPLQRLSRGERGFTLVELLVSIAVLALLVVLFASLFNSAATITTLGNKLMDADSQARQVLDRMAVDFAQMVKRSDIDYFAKGTTAPNSVGGTLAGNDQIAFYSAVPGYYPSTGVQSPVSLVAYRINSQSGTAAFNKLERLGKGLVWNGVSTTDTPIVFLPLTISGSWPYATNANPDPSSPSAYETFGPQIFRFEYSYLLTNGNLSITPPANISGIAAFIVDIGTIDPKSKVLLTNTQIASLAGQLSDYAANMFPGQLRNNWQNTLNANTTLPRPALSGIRVYERFFYLSPPTL